MVYSCPELLADFLQRHGFLNFARHLLDVVDGKELSNRHTKDLLRGSLYKNTAFRIVECDVYTIFMIVMEKLH